MSIACLLAMPTARGLFHKAILESGVGTTSIGGWGMVPGYLAERFPTEARGVGTGFAYHLGVGIAASSPYIVGALQDGGMALAPNSWVFRQGRAFCLGGNRGRR